MLLVAFKQRLCTRYILGQLVGGNDGFHIVDPRHQVAEVGQETVQEIRIIQTGFPFLQAKIYFTTDHKNALA